MRAIWSCGKTASGASNGMGAAESFETEVTGLIA